MQPELQSVRTTDTGYGAIAAPAESQKVLRNTYLLLALTMVPTIVGAYLGIQFAPLMVASPFITLGVMLVWVFGLQFAIIRYRDSAIGVGLLLLMTLGMGLLGGWLTVATGGIAAAFLGHAITRFALFVCTGHTGQTKPRGREVEEIEKRRRPPEGWRVIGSRESTTRDR